MKQKWLERLVLLVFVAAVLIHPLFSLINLFIFHYDSKGNSWVAIFTSACHAFWVILMVFILKTLSLMTTFVPDPFEVISGWVVVGWVASIAIVLASHLFVSELAEGFQSRLSK